MPRVSADPWAFNILKRTLDSSLLKAVASEIPAYRHKAFSVNLLVGTFMSPTFDALIASMPARLSGKLTVELDKADLVQHSALLGDLRAKAAAANVPLAVDGLSPRDFSVLKVPGFRADYAKVAWSADLAQAPPEEIETFVRDTRGHACGRPVLCRCDSPKALAFAKAMWIGLVQGRLADRLFRTGADLAPAA